MSLVDYSSSSSDGEETATVKLENPKSSLSESGSGKGNFLQEAKSLKAAVKIQSDAVVTLESKNVKVARKPAQETEKDTEKRNIGFMKVVDVARKPAQETDKGKEKPDLGFKNQPFWACKVVEVARKPAQETDKGKGSAADRESSSSTSGSNKNCDDPLYWASTNVVSGFTDAGPLENSNLGSKNPAFWASKVLVATKGSAADLESSSSGSNKKCYDPPFWASTKMVSGVLDNECKLDFSDPDHEYTKSLVLSAVLSTSNSTTEAAAHLMVAERPKVMVSAWIEVIAKYEKVSVKKHLEIALELAKKSPKVFKSAIKAAKGKVWSHRELRRVADFISHLLKVDLLKPDAKSLRVTEYTPEKESTVIFNVVEEFLKDKSKQEIIAFLDSYVCDGQLQRRVLSKITKDSRALR